jgi:hypothetical protein
MTALKARLSAMIAPARLIYAELIGEDDDGPVRMPDGLPEAVRSIAVEAVHCLTEYQGPSYAQFYLDRLKRFITRRTLDEALYCDIARLMLMRMSYEDPIRMAQLTLAAAETHGNAPEDDVRQLRLDEMVTSLPDTVADPLLEGLEWLGWQHMPVTRRLRTASRWGRRRLRMEASLRRWRLRSVRYARERAWVERWLHMIDRSLTRQPEAVSAVIQTATMVQGYGQAYRQGLADWHLIIDELAKPVFDGKLRLPDLSAAIAEARAAAMPDPRQAALRRTIAQIKAQADGNRGSVDSGVVPANAGTHNP